MASSGQAASLAADDTGIGVVAAVADNGFDLRAIMDVVESAPVGVVLFDRDRLLYMSQKVIELTGLDRSKALEVGFRSVLHPYDTARFDSAVIAMREGRSHVTQLRTSPDQGPVRTLEVAIFPVRLPPDVAGAVLTVRDATEEAAQLRELDRFRAVADATSDLVGMATLDGRMLYVNPAARRFHGIDVDAPTSDISSMLGIPDEHILTIRSEVWPALMRGEVWEAETDLVSLATGERRPMWVVWVPMRNEAGEVDVVSATFRDLSERRRLEQRLAHAAAHDALTGLPNRERLFQVLADRAATRTPLAVLFCDLDDFKIVNDTLGHAVGDRVLRTVAERLVRVSRVHDVVGRLGGDEFLVVCDGIVGDKEAYDIADRIAEAIHEPIEIGGREHRVSASIGISVRHGDRSARAGDLVLEADIAMYRAKEAGRRHIEIFDGTMRTQMVERIDLERDLRLAIERDEIEVHFQPVVDMTGRIDGFESLVRWRHPERGLLPPSMFLELAESSGLGVELGDVILAQACRAAAAFIAVAPDVQVGFNVSTSQMRCPDFAVRVAAAAAAARVPTGSLVLEVTEDIVMTDVEGAWSLLQQMRSMGVRIAVDDFGTGYSSLSMLRRLPVDVLKIDRSFVDGLGTEPGDTQIVRLVLSLAEELGLMVVAEGVETEEQHQELARLQCPLAQGFYYAAPLPDAEALAHLRDISRPDRRRPR